MGTHDATKPMLKWDTSWRALRDEAGLHGLRFHDLGPALKITYTEEAVADIIDAITYLNERNPTAAAKLDAEISRCIERRSLP